MLWATIQAAGVQSFGEPAAKNFRWPVNRAEALQQLDNFATHCQLQVFESQDPDENRLESQLHASW
jgi:deoxyribodipyrimidine photolyase-related protein